MIAFDQLFAADLPAPAARWSGHPRYNFTGGNNDPEVLPVEALAASAERVLRREGRKLATYHLGEGQMGHAGLRAFVAGKLASMRGIDAADGRHPDHLGLAAGPRPGQRGFSGARRHRDHGAADLWRHDHPAAAARRQDGRRAARRARHAHRPFAHLARGPARPGHPAQVHLHHPDRAEPDRHGAEPRAPARAPAAQQGVRGADLRGRVLCRSAVGGRVAAGAARPCPAASR